MMEIRGQVGALNAGAIATVYEEDVVDNSTFPCVLDAASLVLPDRNGEVPTRGLLLIGDQQTVLTQAANPILHRRKHLPDSLHPMKV